VNVKSEGEIDGKHGASAATWGTRPGIR